jgi:hypothetical protein
MRSENSVQTQLLRPADVAHGTQDRFQIAARVPLPNLLTHESLFHFLAKDDTFRPGTEEQQSEGPNSCRASHGEHQDARGRHEKDKQVLDPVQFRPRTTSLIDSSLATPRVHR